MKPTASRSFKLPRPVTPLRAAMLAVAGILLSVSDAVAQGGRPSRTNPRRPPAATGRDRQPVAGYELVKPLDQATTVTHELSVRGDEVVFVVENSAADKRRVTVLVQEPVGIDPETGIASDVRSTRREVEVDGRSRGTFSLPSRKSPDSSERIDPYSAEVEKEERRQGAKPGPKIDIGEPQKFRPANALVPELDRKTTLRHEWAVSGTDIEFTVENSAEDTRSVVVELQKSVLKGGGTQIWSEVVTERQSLLVPPRSTKSFTMPARLTYKDGKPDEYVNPYKAKIVQEWAIAPQRK